MFLFCWENRFANLKMILSIVNTHNFKFQLAYLTDSYAKSIVFGYLAGMTFVFAT